MNRLSPYVNEIISFIVMILMLAALISGQANEQAYRLASLDTADAEAVEMSNIRLEDE